PETRLAANLACLPLRRPILLGQRDAIAGFHLCGVGAHLCYLGRATVITSATTAIGRRCAARGSHTRSAPRIGPSPRIALGPACRSTADRARNTRASLPLATIRAVARSEEHTSELQS